MDNVLFCGILILLGCFGLFFSVCRSEKVAKHNYFQQANKTIAWVYGLYDSYFSIFSSGKLQDIFVRFGVAIFDFYFIANHNLFNLFIPQS